MSELTPEMLAHIEETRKQASHNYKPQKIKVPKKKVTPKPPEEPDGDHSDSE